VKLRYPIPVLAALVLVASLSGTSAAEDFISRKEALARSNLVVVSGDHNEQWRVCATKNRAYDLRKFTSSGNFGDLSNLSIGKDCGAARTVVVGGAVTGTISHSLTWNEVKSQYDADGLRFEGKSWLASFGLSVQDIEDGFAPRVAEGTEQDNTIPFLLKGAYMDWIRDDAIEDDGLMSGVIKNTLIDGTNRFLSARPSASATSTNHSMVVTITNVLVHMKAMPNERDKADGIGFGGIFKWSDAAGEVEMSDSIFLLDEQPLTDEPFPPGTYSHVILVLGPDFVGRYRTSLPDGVTVTRKLWVWRKARSAWLDAHGRSARALQRSDASASDGTR
jgi:hypothetical protein